MFYQALTREAHTVNCVAFSGTRHNPSFLAARLRHIITEVDLPCVTMVRGGQIFSFSARVRLGGGVHASRMLSTGASVSGWSRPSQSADTKVRSPVKPLNSFVPFERKLSDAFAAEVRCDETSSLTLPEAPENEFGLNVRSANTLASQRSSPAISMEHVGCEFSQEWEGSHKGHDRFHCCVYPCKPERAVSDLVQLLLGVFNHQ